MAPPDTVARVRNVASIITMPPTASNPPARLRREFMKQLLLIEPALDSGRQQSILAPHPRRIGHERVARLSDSRRPMWRKHAFQPGDASALHGLDPTRAAPQRFLGYKPAHCPDDVPVTVLDWPLLEIAGVPMSPSLALHERFPPIVFDSTSMYSLTTSLWLMVTLPVMVLKPTSRRLASSLLVIFTEPPMVLGDSHVRSGSPDPPPE